MAAEAVALADHHGASVSVIAGDELLKRGFPAVHTVGRASSRCVKRGNNTRYPNSKLPKVPFPINIIPLTHIQIQFFLGYVLS